MCSIHHLFQQALHAITDQPGNLPCGNAPAGLFATFSKKRFMMPVPFSPFRRNSGAGFEPDPQAAQGSPPVSPNSGITPADDAGPRLEPPEPPQLVLPSLSKRLSSIVNQQVSLLHLGFPFWGCGKGSGVSDRWRYHLKHYSKMEAVSRSGRDTYNSDQCQQ